MIVDLHEFILRVPWFKRSWVIQESVLSKRAQLVYGAAWASLGDILQADIVLQALRKAGDLTSSAAAGPIWNAFASHRLGMSLLESPRLPGIVDDVVVCNFLAEVRFCKASDGKDKILGLYRLLVNSGVPLPAPDYGKSMATVYRHTTIAVIRCTKSLRVLEQVDGLGHTPDMASWAPDWSSSKHSIGHDVDPRDMKIPVPEPIFSFEDEGRQLCVKGVIIDTIVARSDSSYMHVDERIGAPPDYASWTRNQPLPESKY